MSLFNRIKPLAFSLLLICGIAGQNAFGNSGTQTEIVKVNMPNSDLADLFACKNNPVFKVYLEHGGVFDLNYARSQDKYLEDSINNTLKKYIDNFVASHNGNTNPYSGEGYGPLNCNDEYTSTIKEAYLHPRIHLHYGEFDWQEIKQKPHSNIRQFQISYEYWYGIYPIYNRQTVIVDTTKKEIIPFNEVVIATKLKSKQIQNIILKRYQDVIKIESSYYKNDDYLTNEEVKKNQEVISALLSQIHFDNNIHLLNNGVVFWFTGNTGGFDEQFEVFIPYEEINPALQPRFRK